jgi:hypothetical protein
MLRSAVGICRMCAMGGVTDFRTFIMQPSATTNMSERGVLLRLDRACKVSGVIGE